MWKDIPASNEVQKQLHSNASSGKNSAHTHLVFMSFGIAVTQQNLWQNIHVVYDQFFLVSDNPPTHQQSMSRNQTTVKICYALAFF